MVDDNLNSEKIKTEQFAKISKIKPIQFQRHLYKAVIKKNQS